MNRKDDLFDEDDANGSNEVNDDDGDGDFMWRCGRHRILKVEIE